MFNCKLRHWCDNRDKMLQTWYVVVTTTCPLQTCYSPVTTIRPPTDSLQHGYYTTWPLQSRHNPVTTNSLPRWSLWIATTWSLQPGHYKLATTILPLRSCHNPGHYEFTTTRSLQIHYNIFTTTISPQPTMLQPGHYKLANLVTTAQSLCWLQIPCSKRTILSTQCLLTP